MQYAVLGTIEVRPSPDAAPIDLGSPLQRVLLGLLLSELDRPVSLDRIVDELWGEGPPADPEGSVHTYVSRLRRLLEPDRRAGTPARTLLRTPTGYRLAAPREAVDAVRFADLAATARSRLADGDPRAALGAADDALCLWRGAVALEDAGDREFAVRAREKLAELRLACAEDRLAALLALGRPVEVIPEAESLLAAHPLHERAWVLLIDALHAAGRTADALARYTEVHRLLDEELGVSPGKALQAAQARVLRGEPRVEVVEPAPAPPADRPPLVGRAAEVAVLADLVAGLPRSGPRFVLVDGEAGIGKSRLAVEVTALASAAGARVAWGRCHEDDDAPALWPWHQVLAALTGSRDDVLTGPDEGAFAAFEKVLTTLVSVSADARVVVVVDDLHWADPASLRLLSFLAVELQQGPIAVVATCRAEIRDPGLAQVRATLARTAGFTQVRLGPLDLADTEELVRGVAGAGLGAGDLGDLHERSGGNPFFATELARVLSTTKEDGEVPSGVRDVVDRRLSRLPDGARAVLRLAAAAGQRFDVSLLQRAGGGRDAGGAGTDDADALADALDAAQTADLIRPATPGRLAFAHALVRESLLAATPGLRRTRLHARLAAALRENADPFERAHHLVSGRPFTDVRETVAACAEAADRAARDHAHETAARWWERALAALDADPASEPPGFRQDLLLRAGTSLARAGSWAAAQRLLTAAIDSALERGDTETAATAADQLWGIGGLWFPVTYSTYPDELVQRLEAILAAVGKADSAARVRTLTALATVCPYGPDRTRGLRDSAEAMTVARRMQRPDLLVTALIGRLAGAWLPGHEQEAIDTATELLRLAPAADRPEVAVLALARRAVARLTLGDVAGDAEDMAAAWDLADRHELPLVQAQLVSMQAARAMLTGSLDVAMELVDRASALNERTQLYTRLWQDLVMRAFIWIDQGCLPQRLADMDVESAQQDGGGGSALLTAIALLQAGRAPAAAATLAAEDALGPLPMQWDGVSITCWQALVAADLAAEPEVRLDPAVPAAIADRLLPYADHLAIQGGIGALGPVGVYLGCVEAAAGRTAAAEAHLRAGIATAERHGMRPALARGRLALAELLCAEGDGNRAAAEASAALAVAEDVGMELEARRARRLAHG